MRKLVPRRLYWRQKRHARLARLFCLGLSAILLSAILVVQNFPRLRAATYAASAQAESGIRTGNVQVVSNTGASGGAAVLFGGGSCKAAAGAALKDQHPDEEIFTDSWPHTVPGKAIVYFETRALTSEFAGYVAKGAQHWSKSVCIDARAVS